ncbi:ImmA/IrrE family metallo-endopeptidase [uncultured Sphingomonas sp.]|uniref:ImmA/IrrE family metallo-endopeptidase n=1 Tax=uncultured Sphingomonas sp. TaxID=158754 RepID=UPI0026081A9C|nr:ImmA/IrrE family metallo-endopeptidase [uncultured Sphingomonas sp.]
MRRGFKADAERRSVAARERLGLQPTDKLCPWEYANALGAMVFGADELELDPEHARQLLQRDPDSWSGMTLYEEGTHVVVLNSAHPQTRQTATLMHEIAHITLEHVPADVSVSPSGLVLLSDYSADQEEEADWLGAALLLPELALLERRGRGLSMAAIANAYGVSEALCQWRCRMTGVEKRLAFRMRA